MDDTAKSYPLFPKPLHIAKVIAPLKYKRNIVRVVEEIGEIEPILVDPRTGIDQLHVEDRRNTVEGYKSKINNYLSALDKDLIQTETISIDQSETGVLEYIKLIANKKGARIGEIIKRKEEISSRRVELKNIKSLISRFSDLSIDSSMLVETRYSKTILGTVYPGQITRLLWALEQVTDGKYFYLEEENISPKQETATILVSILQKDADVVLDNLKGMSVQEVAIPGDIDFDGLSIHDCEIEESDLDKEEIRLESELETLAANVGHEINAALEICEIELSRISLELKMRRTETTCVLWAWIPTELQEKFTTKITSVTDGAASFDFRKGDFDPQTVPSRVDNSKFMGPMRSIVSSFGTPALHEIDPFPFVKYLLPIFFGIMFADVGHGLLFLSFGLWAKRKKDRMLKPPEGISAYIFGGPELIITMGAWATFFGFPMNSFFGDETILWQVPFLKAIFEKTTWALLFNVEHGHIERDYFSFLILSFSIGAIIILLGLVINVYQLRLYRHSDAEYQAATSLFVGYLLIVVGVAIFIPSYVSENIEISAFASTLVMILLILGFVSLFATMVIEYRAHKLDGLMLAFDHILSLMSNTFSFGRLLAMNTVHFVLAFLPYLFINLWWKPILNHSVEHWIPAELIPVWILAAVIGALIVVPVEGVFSTLQALRLTWVEFFGKFYKGNGIEFKPVKINRIYTVEDLS